MSTFDEINRAREAETAELELTAGELLALSTAPRVQPKADELAGSPDAGLAQWVQSAASKTSQSSSPRTQSPRPGPSRTSAIWRVATATGLTIAAIVGGGLYANGKPGDRTTASTLTTPHRWTPESSSELDDVPGGQAVQFANPFDASVVFEFPPGTSEAQAREEVRRILLQRAQERQT
jgi:hypothetical protein